VSADKDKPGTRAGGDGKPATKTVVGVPALPTNVPAEVPPDTPSDAALTHQMPALSADDTAPREGPTALDHKVMGRVEAERVLAWTGFTQEEIPTAQGAESQSGPAARKDSASGVKVAGTAGALPKPITQNVRIKTPSPGEMFPGLGRPHTARGLEPEKPTRAGVAPQAPVAPHGRSTLLLDASAPAQGGDEAEAERPPIVVPASGSNPPKAVTQPPPWGQGAAHVAPAFPKGAPPKPDADDHHERDPRMVLKLGPEAARRRAQFQKYVKIAVVAASVLCLAALVKGAVAGNHDEPMTHRTSAALVAPPLATVPAEQAPAPTEQRAIAEPQATAPAATETAAAAPTQAPAEQAVPAAAPPPEEAASATAPPAKDETAVAPTATDTEEAPTPDPKEAAKAKRASQAALERGKVADAIESGERSVALDPTDAEAWLILGAAYQTKGDQKNARRSFKSCLEQSKRGPKWECAQMPH